MARYTVTARVGPRVERLRFQELGPALQAIEERGRRLAEEARTPAVQPKLMRRFEPVQRVVARLELAGPDRLRAGLDVRGDGSVESYTGRFRKRLLEERDGESAYAALRRAVSAR